MNTRQFASLACLLAAAAGQAHGQCYGQFLNAGDPQTNAFNGVALSMDGQYVLSGANGRTVSAKANAGEVYAYAPISGTWGQVSHFVANDPAVNAWFGSSIAMGGGHQWAVVGAPGLAGDTGGAYFFVRDINTGLWSQNDKITLGAAAGDQLGYSVAMNKAGTIAVIGSPNAAVTDLFGTTNGAGKALVYARSGNTWTYQMDLHQYDASIRHVDDLYGYAVAADGNVVVTGVRNGDAPNLTNCGFVHIWTRDANNVWTADGEVYAPDAASNAYFGSTVAISGNQIAVGAPYATTNGLSGAGAVYLYKKTNGVWSFDQKVIPTDNFPGLNFGAQISISGSYMVIGTGAGEQRTYLFRLHPSGEWVQEARYENPGTTATAAQDAFGCAVAVDGFKFVSGAWGYDTVNYAQSGALYLFDTPAMGSDTCSGAWYVGPGTYHACTNNCTIDGYSTCGTGAPVGPDIWFSYTAPASGEISIDTQGSSFDTILSVHSGCPGVNANTIVCNDDFAAPQRWSKASLIVGQGQTYLIRVAGYNRAMGEVTLNIGTVNTCYANCDASSTAPILNVQDFSCFLNKFANGDPWANCDASSIAPVLNVQDFSCFLNKFSAGCS